MFPDMCEWLKREPQIFQKLRECNETLFEIYSEIEEIKKRFLRAHDEKEWEQLEFEVENMI